jgi:hypothetical protein
LTTPQADSPFLQEGQPVEVTLTKRIVTILPVPTTGGTAIFALPSDPPVMVGYINLASTLIPLPVPQRTT